MTGATLEAETYLFSPSHQSGVNGGHWDKLNIESSISSNYLQTSESRKKSHKTQPPVAISPRKPEPRGPRGPHCPRLCGQQGPAVGDPGIRVLLPRRRTDRQTVRGPCCPTPHPRPNLGNHLLGPLRLRDQPLPVRRWAPRGDPPPPPDWPARPPGGGCPAPPPAPVAGGPAPDAAPATGDLGPSWPTPSVCPRGPPTTQGPPSAASCTSWVCRGPPGSQGGRPGLGRGASRPNDGRNMGPLRTRQGPGQQVHESLKQAKGHPSGDSTASVSILR
ncbi:unnamed protein product [Nyctereutes procyonoides]|uniref:(raccoon dog) hypothetical protein n=1 Tax=Nyctereutes procyonoides TaxID=34880 RepID=A0A811Z7J3_NYCPR|nr:unnamed protein product [Nyctereutes procyonoides]